MIDQSWIPLMATLVVMTGVAVVDYAHFRIPNSLILPFGLAGIVFNGGSSGWSGLQFSLVGLTLGFVLLLLPYLMGGFGAGDVKLLTATGAWLGAAGVLCVFVVSALLLGAASIYLMLCNPGVRRAAILNLKLTLGRLRVISMMLSGEDRVQDILLREDRRQRAIPYGVVLAVGLALIFVWKLTLVP